MTAFESYFHSIKKVLGNEVPYDVWPDFQRQYDEHECTWATLRGFGEVLISNCSVCDGPSDSRHVRCKECVEKRSKKAKEAYQKATGRGKEKWSTLFLCRIHTK